MTNIERIRSMPEDELAARFGRSALCPMLFEGNGYIRKCVDSCVRCWAEYFKEERDGE